MYAEEGDKVTDLEEALRAKLATLKRMFLDNVTRPLSVEEARVLGVCRLCREPATGPLLLEYGKEFAHLRCPVKEPQ